MELNCFLSLEQMDNVLKARLARLTLTCQDRYRMTTEHLSGHDGSDYRQIFAITSVWGRYFVRCAFGTHFTWLLSVTRIWPLMKGAGLILTGHSIARQQLHSGHARTASTVISVRMKRSLKEVYRNQWSVSYWLRGELLFTVFDRLQWNYK